MDLIIVDMLPYNLVEGDAFRRLNLADPDTLFRYRKKSEKYFRTTLMPATYFKVKEKVILLLEKAEWVSLTTDIWSNPAKTCSLLSYTAHFIQATKRQKVILAASALEDNHTGKHISETLINIIAEFRLTNKVHMVIRDNACNMQSAMRLGNFASIGCVAHTLQLVIHEIIFKSDPMMDIIKKCRKIVGHFKRSEQACRYLKQFQETCDLPRHTLIQDVETRWNSTYLMLERLMEQKFAVNLYMAERGGIEVPAAEEWVQIRDLISALKCFYQATLDISSDSSSISLIIPLIVMLNSKLAPKDEDTENLKLLKIRLCESVNKRFSYSKSTPNLLIATLIDPRFKGKYFTGDEIGNTKAKILELLQQNLSNQTVPMILEDDDPQPSSSTSASGLQHDDLWESHDKFVLPVESGTCLNEPPPFEGQLLSFLKEPLLLRNTDVYAYWASSPYNYLRTVAIQFLSAPPTSVPSKQLFCAAGQIYADRRSNLSGENVEKL
ncbi:zinc finger BED domain-containing protein 4-like [Eupeodes corollae]|uniref:zinc finger BED domain-containing protein 4-like n=1 Tax=Eupeodes corollae TaxID=290404 RepID=UPI00248F4DE7|nr:zinc finger BED domain-containing protein 4-like [Eupeodes corollae]